MNPPEPGLISSLSRTPSSKTAVVSAEAGEAASSLTHPPDPAPRTRILIVEDDADLRHTMLRSMRKTSYDVRLAENGVAGLAVAHEFHPDIILSDLKMPMMDGREFCERIKAEPRFVSTFFILLTGNDIQEDKIDSLNAGVDDYLVKPCHPDELLARLRAAERIVRLQRELTSRNEALASSLDRIARELEITSKIQRSLLPAELPPITGFQFAAYYQPSTECSGDYYDLLQLEDERFGLVMADVSGHGTPAMVAMAMIRCLVNVFAPEAESAADLLRTLNHLLYQHLPTSQYATLFYAICDPRTGQVQYSSAGHRPPLLIHGQKRTADYLRCDTGVPLKLVTEDADYENRRITLEPDDSLLLYTDGILEARGEGGTCFGSERLARSVLQGGCASPQAVLETLVMEVEAFAGTGRPTDDVSMLLVKRDLDATPSRGQQAKESSR